MNTEEHPSSFLRGVVFMLIAGFCYSLMVATVKYAAQRVPIYQAVFIRVLVNLIFVLVPMVRHRVSFAGTNLPLLFLRGVLGTVSIGLAFFAATQIHLVDATTLVKSSVIFTALFAVFWLKEPIKPGLLFNTLLAFIGVILIIKPSWGITNWGGLAALSAAVLIGFTGALIRRLQETEHSLTIIFWFVAMASLVYPIVFGRTFVSLTSFELCVLTFAGTIGTIGQSFFTYAYRYAKASEITPFLYSEVLFAALFGSLYFHELPDAFSVVGTAVVIFSGVSIVRIRNRVRPAIPPDE
ncbi:MAG: DMT family transporter [Bdellovibrionales bacterium]|nr:DMT family transporter [Bdellovibrionales bacterium]